MKKQKICIIGGGMSGLMTASVLSKLNIDIDLITGNVKKNTKNNKTTAISQSNYEYLDKLNVFKFIKKDFWPCKEIKLYTKDNKKSFSKVYEFKNGKTEMFYMMSNSNIIKNITNLITKNKYISVKKNLSVLKLIPSNFLKTIKFSNNTKSDYNLVIICAGSNSNLVKSIFNERTLGFSYKETSGTTILKHKSIENKIARQIFMENEILALLPISKTETSIVWSVKKSLMNKYRLKKNKLFKKKIEFYTKDFLKKLQFNTPIEFRDLNLLIRKKYYKERVVLFGDSLHVVHPLAGQGFNMVLRDLKCLENLLKKKIALGLDIGSKDVLSEFSNKIKPRNFVYSIGIDLIKDIFSEKRPLNYFRNKIIKKLNNNNFIKDQFFKLADKGLKF